MENFSRLPVDITLDIFIRLPAESVLECKAVSKAWTNLIQHPSFSKMHITRHNHHPHSGELGFLALTQDGTQLYCFEYIENHETPLHRSRRINLTPPFKYNAVVGSINGLICLKGPKEIFCIWNPITKEYVILPEPRKNSGHCKYRWIGFGYLSLTNEYKVVVVNKLKKEPNFVDVMVYTLGSGNGWQNTGKFSLRLQFDNVYKEHGIFANGALHWRDREMIFVFDLAHENFSDLSPPPSLRGSYFEFGVLGGFLCLALTNLPSLSKLWSSDLWLYKDKEKNNRFDIKEKDEHQSIMGWSKGFTATYSIPLAFTKSGGILCYNYRFLNVYDPKTYTSKTLVDFTKQFCRIISHKNTLVSVKELGERNTKIIKACENKKRKRRDLPNMQLFIVR